MDYLNIGKQRTEGYKDGLQMNGLEYNEDLVLKIGELGDSDAEQRNLENRINGVFEKHPDIDGIFGVNEIYAVTALNVARLRGLQVPEQLSVIGFSDGILSKYARPHLTTISQHGAQIGELAAQTLINRLEIEEETPFTNQLIKTELIVRDSTKTLWKAKNNLDRRLSNKTP